MVVSEISGTGGFVTGSTNFFVTNGLDVRGFLSSSTGGVFNSSSLIFTNTDKLSHISARNSNLILSSSVGSIIAASSSVDLVNADKNYHIRAPNSRLILSSSAGSYVHVSGALFVRGAGTGGTQVQTILDTDIAHTGSYDLGAGAVSMSTNGVFIGSGKTFTFGGSSSVINLVKMVADTSQGQFAIGMGVSVGYQLLVTTAASATVDYTHPAETGGNPGFYVHSAQPPSVDVNQYVKLQHTQTEGRLLCGSGSLILSSSIGSTIMFSGAAKYQQYAQSALPASADTFTGSIVWVSDKKCLAVFGPEGWTRILTGTL